MALQTSWTAIGIDFPAAYIRVEQIRARETGRTFGYLTVYTDDTKQHPIAQLTVDFTLNKGGDNVHTQAYNAAKLLPELAGAVDV